MHNQWYSCTVLEPGHLVPHASLTQHIAVITAENYDCVLVESAVLEDFEQLAHLIVDVGASAIIGTTSAFDGFVRDVCFPEVDGFEDSLRMRIHLVLADVDFGH